MTECTALTQHPGAPEQSIDYFIEDFFKLNQVVEPESELCWQHNSTQPPHPESLSPVPNSNYHLHQNQSSNHQKDTLLLKHFNNSASSKTRLNSYEDSLSSPESVFSIRYVCIFTHIASLVCIMIWVIRSTISIKDEIFFFLFPSNIGLASLLEKMTWNSFGAKVQIQPNLWSLWKKNPKLVYKPSNH